MDFGADFRFQSVREGLGARLNYDEFCDKIEASGGNCTMALQDNAVR